MDLCLETNHSVNLPEPRGAGPSPTPGDPVPVDLRPSIGRYVVDTAPGSYRLDVSPSKPDRKYALTVEECGVPPSLSGEA